MAKKRERLLTKRYTAEEGNNTAFEFIEMEEYNGQQYLYLRCGESRISTEEVGDEYFFRIVEAEGCFPISVDLVQERFLELGREYKSTGRERCLTVKDLFNG